MSNIDFVNSDMNDLACHTGVTFNAELLFIEDCSNVPDDLTGYAATLVIYDTIETAVIDTITGDISEPLKGRVSFVISASITRDYPLGMFNHHIELTIDDNVYRVAQGNFEVSE